MLEEEPSRRGFQEFLGIKSKQVTPLSQRRLLVLIYSTDCELLSREYHVSLHLRLCNEQLIDIGINLGIFHSWRK